MSTASEIEELQNKILDWQKLITGNKYKDEIRVYKKLIKRAEENIILLKVIEQDLQEIRKANTDDFINGVSGESEK